MAADVKVTINNLNLRIPNLISSVETQFMFNEATENSNKISFDDYYTKRRVLSDMIVQADIGSTQQVSSPKYLIYAHQTQERINVPNKKEDIVLFDEVDLRKYHVELDGQGYPTDNLLIRYEEDDYIEQYRDLKLFFKRYIGEPILNLFFIITRDENEKSY